MFSKVETMKRYEISLKYDPAVRPETVGHHAHTLIHCRTLELPAGPIAQNDAIWRHRQVSAAIRGIRNGLKTRPPMDSAPAEKRIRDVTAHALASRALVLEGYPEASYCGATAASALPVPIPILRAKEPLAIPDEIVVVITSLDGVPLLVRVPGQRNPVRVGKEPVLVGPIATRRIDQLLICAGPPAPSLADAIHRVQVEDELPTVLLDSYALGRVECGLRFASQLLGLSTTEVRQLVRDGKLNAVESGRRLIFATNDLDGLMWGNGVKSAKSC